MDGIFTGNGIAAADPSLELLEAAAAAAFATRTLHQAAAKLGLPLRTATALIKQAAAEGLIPEKKPPQGRILLTPQGRVLKKPGAPAEKLVRIFGGNAR
ncbi:hypothetical protein [Azospirillum sp. TSO5]|uniref:hypothetical protein n=1 Tax=Azospirillum sp. TSO5 TaxID=716760 RepID=UPI000D61207E|nr:hypothetical protein [Azospirillum sp. TSO5]PWC92942.1 hypothetical protein TSO5_16065 [Azospirillum sp. TSO5]